MHNLHIPFILGIWTIFLLHVNCILGFFYTVGRFLKFFSFAWKQCVCETQCNIFYLVWRRKQSKNMSVMCRSHSARHYMMRF